MVRGALAYWPTDDPPRHNVLAMLGVLAYYQDDAARCGVAGGGIALARQRNDASSVCFSLDLAG